MNGKFAPLHYWSNGQYGVQEALKTCWNYAKNILIFNARYRQSVAYKKYFLYGSEILRRLQEALQ